MVPTGIALLAMIRLLQTEMRGTAGAAPTLWVALLAVVVDAALILQTPVKLDQELLAIVGRSATVIWPLGLLLSLQIYARRVIYVSNEPAALPNAPEGARTMVQNWLHWWKPRIKSDRTRLSAAAANNVRKAPISASAKPASNSGSAPAAAAIDERSADAAEPAQSQPASKPTAPTAAAPAARTPTPVTAAAAHAGKPVAEQPAASQDFSDDEEDDDDAASLEGDRYRGLSKKERKKLRKLEQRERRNMMN
jgi:hypothetical protein